MRKLPAVLLPFLLLLSCTGCPFSGTPQDNDPPDPVEEFPLISFDVAWKAEFPLYGAEFLYEGDICYVTDRSYKGMTAVNLETGAILWHVTNVFIGHGKGQIIGDELYIMSSSLDEIPSIGWFHTDGTFIGRIILPDNTFRSPSSYLNCENNTLYWGTFLGDEAMHGVLSMDLDTVELIDPENKLYEGVREQIYPASTGVGGRVLLTEEYILIGGFNLSRPDLPGFMCLLDKETHGVIWRQENALEPMMDSNCFFMFGNDLYVSAGGIGRFDLLTGERVYHSKYGFSSSTDGVEFWDGKIYGTSGAFADNPEDNGYVYTVWCIDQETGDFIWGDMLDSSHGTLPQAHEGVLYVAGEHLMCYDANTGKRLGRDPVLTGDSWNLYPGHHHVTKSGENLFIFHDETAMYAVKMNIHEKLNLSRGGKKR